MSLLLWMFISTKAPNRSAPSLRWFFCWLEPWPASHYEFGPIPCSRDFRSYSKRWGIANGRLVVFIVNMSILFFTNLLPIFETLINKRNRLFLHIIFGGITEKNAQLTHQTESAFFKYTNGPVYALHRCCPCLFDEIGRRKTKSEGGR